MSAAGDEFGRFVDALEKIRDQVTQSRVEITGIRGALGEIEQHLRALNGRTARLEGRADNHDKRIGEQESYVPLRRHLAEEQGRVYERVERMERKFYTYIGIGIGSGFFSGTAIIFVVRAVFGWN